MDAPLNPWLTVALLLAAQTAWLAAVRALGRRGLKPEYARKLFHAGSGALLLSLPLLFQSAWPVVVWGVIAGAGMLVILLRPELRQLVGNVYSVRRVSYGDLHFTIGVVLLFFFAHTTPYTYYVPLSMLSFADAASALVGKRFGKLKYEATEGRKTVEGSLTFFAVSALSVVVWAPTLPHAHASQIILIALILGLLGTLLEAIAWRGLDNLFIPLGGYVLLVTYLMMSAGQLALNLLLVALLVGFVLLWRRRTTLNDSALVTGALFGYSAWTVAGQVFAAESFGAARWVWLLIPLLLFLVYNVAFSPAMVQSHHLAHNVDAVFSAVFAGALWLYLAFYLDRLNLVFPYAVSFAAVAMNLELDRRAAKFGNRAGAAVIAALGALAMVGLALWLIYLSPGSTGELSRIPMLILAGIGGVGIAAGLRLLMERKIDPENRLHWRWHVRALTALAGSAVAAIALLHWHGT